MANMSRWELFTARGSFYVAIVLFILSVRWLYVLKAEETAIKEWAANVHSIWLEENLKQTIRDHVEFGGLINDASFQTK